MKLVDKKLYADEGKVLDFAEPKYALDDEHVKTQVHLYTKFIRNENQTKCRIGKIDRQSR